MKKIFLLIIAFLILNVTGHASIKDLLPTPQRVEIFDKGFFQLGRPLRIIDPTKSLLLKRFIELVGGFSNSPKAPLLKVEIVDQIKGSYDYPLYGYANEAYSLKIEKDQIISQAINPIGVTRAVQTLNQLIENDKSDKILELVHITDWPAFKLRGFMHDVGRCFISINELKKRN